MVIWAAMFHAITAIPTRNRIVVVFIAWNNTVATALDRSWKMKRPRHCGCSPEQRKARLSTSATVNGAVTDRQFATEKSQVVSVLSNLAFFVTVREFAYHDGSSSRLRNGSAIVCHWATSENITKRYIRIVYLSVHFQATLATRSRREPSGRNHIVGEQLRKPDVLLQ